MKGFKDRRTTVARVISSVSKALSANDVGLTGAHQAGILVPKDQRILEFFPRLVESSKNPSKIISCHVPDLNMYAEFRFVHYNNKVVEGGTRDEYRLTRMTAVLRDLGAREGDLLIFSKDGSGQIALEVERSGVQKQVSPVAGEYRLQGGWKIVIKGE
jgi:hypothetical protein